MMNAGPDYFYDRTFRVADGYSREVISKVNYKYSRDSNKDEMTAILNFSNGAGLPFSGKKVRFEIMYGGEAVAKGKGETDSKGDLEVKVLNEQKGEVKGSYIQSVIDLDDKKVSSNFPIKAALSQSEVQFFPEGGVLVEGVRSRISFKATGVDGLGVAVSGKVEDDQGKEMKLFSTEHAGTGIFELTPEQGRSYKAKVNYADGSEKIVALPQVQPQGYVLALYDNQESDSVLVRINSNEQTYKSRPQVGLIVQMGGEVLYTATLNIIKPFSSVWISKKHLRTGIVQFTLFSDKEEPLNERVAFVRKADQLDITVKTANAIYGPRDKVEIELESKNSRGIKTAGSFSISVTDMSKLPVDETSESTILTNLLLTSDLKGYIEKPNYYFIKDILGERHKHLDLLMMSQGYRRFVWKEVMAESHPQPQYPVEQLAIKISGWMQDYAKKPVAGGKVLLFNMEHGIMRDTVTDENGKFVFDNLLLKDNIKLTVQGRTAKNKSRLDVFLDGIPKQKITINKNIWDIDTGISGGMEAYLDSKKKEEGQLQKFGRLNRIQRFDAVTVTERLTNRAYSVRAGSADYNYTMKNPENCSTLAICLAQRIPGLRFETGPDGSIPILSRGGRTALKVVLDGKMLDSMDVGDFFDGNPVDPADIVSVQLVYSSQALLSYLGGPSLVIITNGNRSQRTGSKDVVIARPRGFNKVKEFYSPQYDKANIVEGLDRL